MEIPEGIRSYIMDTYAPEAVIVYGSYADGSAGEHSDFDALIIADHEKCHDASRISGVVLDLFIYPPEAVRAPLDPEEFLQIFDGEILLDQNGLARQLQQKVLAYIEDQPEKSEAELRQELDWCGKMLARSSRGDPEGYFRWHWLLQDSLEIWCHVRGLGYFGPKKALRAMARRDEKAFALYSAALRELDGQRLADWVEFLRSTGRQRGI